MGKPKWIFKATVSNEPKQIIEEIEADHPMEVQRLVMKKLTVNQVCNMVYCEVVRA